MTRLRHRWRYRTARVRRLRALVHEYSCAKCGEWNWEDCGEQPTDLLYSEFRRVWRCRACGYEDLD